MYYIVLYVLCYDEYTVRLFIFAHEQEKIGTIQEIFNPSDVPIYIAAKCSHEFPWCYQKVKKNRTNFGWRGIPGNRN